MVHSAACGTWNQECDCSSVGSSLAFCLMPFAVRLSQQQLTKKRHQTKQNQRCAAHADWLHWPGLQLTWPLPFCSKVQTLTQLSKKQQNKKHCINYISIFSHLLLVPSSFYHYKVYTSKDRNVMIFSLWKVLPRVINTTNPQKQKGRTRPQCPRSCESVSFVS